jgi:CRISPR-associated protein Cas5h
MGNNKNLKFLVFDIWGDFGHFKKFYTTSSPLTFCIPPPTAVYGILSAIVGLDKQEYLKHINSKNTLFGLKILNPVSKIRITFNYIDTKNSNSFNLIKNRTQLKTEMLKNPKYRLIINHENIELFEDLINKVKNKESVYTVSLGLANLLANFKFVGVFDGEFLPNSEILNSVILSENIQSIDFKDGQRFTKEKLPINMSVERIVDSYKDVIVETQGREIYGKFSNCYKLSDGTIFSPYNRP